ncbi:MAG: hypothetical protein H6Q68_2615 [Firmicutes bacterium]|nr:hypothetical protein [Bacillota bacterium]
MNFSKKTILKLGLPLVLAVSAFAGTIAEAESPSATAVQIQTFGTLPVMMLNLTQSPINFNITANSMGGYAGGAIPLAAGLSGVYYPQSNGATSMFTNALTPSVAVNGNTSASLMPVATIGSSTSTPSVDNVTFTKNHSFMNMFTLFPSWSTTTDYYQVQYSSLSNLKNKGGAAYSYTELSGYPTSKSEDVTAKVNALAHSSATPSLCSINMNLMNNGQVAATYHVNINNLGAGTASSITPPPPNDRTLGDAFRSMLDIVCDVETIIASDGLGILDIIVGIPSTISSMSSQLDGNNTGNVYHAASSKGVEVSATAVLNNTAGTTFTLQKGNTDALMYEVVSTNTNQQIPLFEQNSVFIATWRQNPTNTGSLEHNSADTLIVAVINNGIYASNQIQQYMNGNSSQLSTAKAPYKPTTEQAHDTKKIFAILKDISRNHPEEAKKIIEMFGIHGKYEKIKKDPNAVKSLNVELQTILEKHKSELPAIEEYLTKLAHKS